MEMVMDLGESVMTQLVGDSSMSSPLLGFLRVLGFQPATGTWAMARDYSLILASVVYLLRIISLRVVTR
jgi:hypothetical protein